jgi:hypothetical protein
MKKNDVVLKSPDFQDKVICPICNKEFTLKEKYMIAGGYACKWKCFLKEVKRQEAEKIITGKGKNNKQKKK